jgi:hypothetical protein
MSRNIADYLAKLADDEDMREAHRAAPQGAMKLHGLDDREREIVASGDHERIRAAVREEDPQLAEAMRIVME